MGPMPRIWKTSMCPVTSVNKGERGNQIVGTSVASMEPGNHRWASTSISMSAISDILHRHLLFGYRRQICRTEKRHSDIGSVLISTSESIPISDIEEKK